MSKMDALRAMREAKYEAAAKAARPAKTAAPKLPKADPAKETTKESAEGLCGHRAISGRTCTREAGHTAKSHRYS
ncbi:MULTISPECIES: hypothetical protein [unclassified Nocardioides]|uniref:hypothetical protein n=1 Tax=unclassified Nocardioides TaxID=2615069 RepID=UPI0009EFAECA|nr:MULTISPECIES: hypothetical protein [unclassified Nocardioides]GAW51488.1 uncharacterized protein PD653B2_3831 [Nocardioides sp. PD653-B2]GAW54078.1 uncharacterized protein PD653_1485 [Nocardioides sp. PD653]